MKHTYSACTSQELQTHECQIGKLLLDLFLGGTTRIDRPEAWNAQAYLEALAIPEEIASTTGVGYLEAGAAKRLGETALKPWEEHLVFPLLSYGPREPSASPVGFAGRSLAGWQSRNPNQAEHLQSANVCWVKTALAGWFWTFPHLPVSPLIVVNEPGDRLVLLASGFEPHEVLALAGMPLQAQYLPSSVCSLLLAFDGQRGGQEAAKRLARQLQFCQIPVECCFSSHAYEGKDWSTRWWLYGAAGLETVYAHHALLAHNL